MLFLSKKSTHSTSFKADTEFAEVSKAFTLIEVLVVVTIMAVLIAITLTSVDNYQNKADDVVVGADLSQIRKIAAMIYTDEHSYKSICDAGTINDNLVEYPQLKVIEDKVEEITGDYPVCFSVKKEYCVQSELISGEYFCVDSTGFAGKIEGDYCENINRRRNCSPG